MASTTLSQYIDALKRYFYPVFEDRPIAGIEYEKFAVYMAGLPLDTAKTFNNIMTPAGGVFAFAMKTGKVARDITCDIESRRGQKPLPDPLDIREVDVVLTHIGKKYGQQWLNYFESALFSGCRPSEIIALTWDNVDFRRERDGAYAYGSKPLILWRARQESNLYQKLRRLSFYPLNYGRGVVIVACFVETVLYPSP